MEELYEVRKVVEVVAEVQVSVAVVWVSVAVV